MELSEQKMTIDLPTLLVDSCGGSVSVIHPGLSSMGYLAVEGKMEFGVRVHCLDDDPTRLSLDFRPLSAHYSPPADCHPEVLRVVHRVNRELSDALLQPGT